jgi:NDP-sugar pyrophosphorylase family protein
MVLAAGLGTRLWPLTGDRAKPAVPFLGKPLVAWCLELLAKHGFARAVVNTHYLPESVRAGASAAGMDVAFSHEREILGTAGALSKAREDGLLDPTKPTLIMNGKLFTDLDLGAVIETHERSGASVTMALRTNDERERFREVLVEDGWVRGFGEVDPKGPSPLLFTGVHAIAPEVLARIPIGNSDTVKDVYPPLIEARRIRAHVDDRGRWWELSTLERYLDLHLRAAEEGLTSDVVIGARSTIAPGAKVTRSVLWEDAHVQDGAVLDRVVLGAGVTLAPGTKLERTVVVRKDRAGEDDDRGEAVGDLLYVAISPTS